MERKNQSESAIGRCMCINPLAKLDIISSIDELIIHDQKELKKPENINIKEKLKGKKLLTDHEYQIRSIIDRTERIGLLKETIKNMPNC